MAVERRYRRIYAFVFAAMVIAFVLPGVLRDGSADGGPSIELVYADGSKAEVTLAQMKRLAPLVREGSYQNQFGNWRDQGTYAGVLLSALLGDASYDSATAVASDGYRVKLPRERIVDDDYPMVLAYEFNGIEVPEWIDGFRIAVLPEDGAVSNAEYGAVSAGSFWIKNVVRLELADSE